MKPTKLKLYGYSRLFYYRSLLNYYRSFALHKCKVELYSGITIKLLVVA